MSFTINAGTLFVGALLFLLAVFVKPLVMVLRDKAVWWWIEKYIINDQLKRDIKDFSEEHRYHLTRMHMKDEFHAVEEGEIEDDTLRKYYVLNADNEIKFDSEDYVKIMHDCQAKVAWYEAKKLELTKASSLYDSLTKHFDQDGDNPIQEALNNRKVDIELHGSAGRLGLLNTIIHEIHPGSVIPF